MKKTANNHSSDYFVYCPHIVMNSIAVHFQIKVAFGDLLDSCKQHPFNNLQI